MQAVRLICLLLVLVGCQPKGSVLYQYPDATSLPIEQVVVVVDYLNLRDDVGKYWDFDSYFHEQNLNRMLTSVNQQLQLAGYPTAHSYLLTSGLLIKAPLAVEHYRQEVLQAELLYPPFTRLQHQMDDKHLALHQEILTLMVKYIAQRRHSVNDETAHRGMQMSHQTEALKLPAETAVLYLHVDLSAPGVIKQISSMLLAGALASQADYGSVHLDGTPRQQASAFLVHLSNGQILWKNHSKTWSPEQPMGELLKQFPAASNH